jgi:hypothetical protein
MASIIAATLVHSRTDAYGANNGRWSQATSLNVPVLFGTPHWSRCSQMETPSAQISITQPREIALYLRVFAAYARSAIYGREARAVISSALHDLQQQ